MKIEIPTLSPDLLEQMTRKELLKLLSAEQHVRGLLLEEVAKLENENKELEAGVANIGGILVKFQNRIFGKSSERSKSEKTEPPKKKNAKCRRTSKLPSERFPNATIIERDVELQSLPDCGCCGHEMADSGLTEVSEYLQVIPKEFVIIRQRRHKYRCSKCHGSVTTARGLPRIKPGSTYSDKMMIDIAMSKYCDLLPIERYRAMAERQGFPGLPAYSLIETTHYLADFVAGAVERVKQEVVSKKIMTADEPPHRMLEGSHTPNWYLWGFSTPGSCYFEIHDTRSGDVAFELLEISRCQFLVTDVFAGYTKAVRIANEHRLKRGLPPILSAYCNAHSRRKFKECAHAFPEEAAFYLDAYKKIYSLESRCKDQPKDEVREIRHKMLPFFTAMRERAADQLNKYSSKSDFTKALKYFVSHYDGFTQFIRNHEVPIDNNSQERALRSPVVGRKTWYGTHSQRGAETAAKLFTLVESCKVNKVNPRAYFRQLVEELHQGKAPFTPLEFTKRLDTSLHN